MVRVKTAWVVPLTVIFGFGAVSAPSLMALPLHAAMHLAAVATGETVGEEGGEPAAGGGSGEVIPAGQLDWHMPDPEVSGQRLGDHSGGQSDRDGQGSVDAVSVFH